MAMKIPRLLRDSLRENANVADLMQEEARIVYRLWRGNASIRGLLPANAFGDNPLALPIISDALRAGGGQEGVQRSLILVSFEKGKKPRFVDLGLTANNDVRLPEGIDPQTSKELGKLFTRDTVQEILRLGCPKPDEGKEPKTVGKGESKERLREGTIESKEYRLGKAVFITDEGHDQQESHPQLLSKSIRVQDRGRTWYAFVPAVVYHWARGTLQEHLSSPERKPWTPSDHFKFFNQILAGLRSLHRNGFLHADLRPANIMYLGHADDPEDYYLIDYGSTAVDRVHAPLEIHEVGGSDERHLTTIPGPIVGPFRSSPFYAPERRSATERETADCALIITLPAQSLGEGRRPEGRHLVGLGWRRDLLEPGSDAIPRDDAIQLLLRTFGPNPGQGDETLEFLNDPLGWPCPGDRLRIRDYIFEIRRATVQNGMQLFECTERCFQVFHDRVSVLVHNDEEFELQQHPALKDVQGKGVRGIWWIPISRVVELYQVSEATDLYSFGAVCLYCLYRCAPVITEDGQPPRSNASLDADFDRMLATLADVGYFKHIWPYIDGICQALQKNFEAHQNATEEDIKSHDIAWNSIHEYGGASREDPWRSLYDLAQAVTSMVCQTVEQSRRILVALDFNVAHFLLLLHFVLCCLHRRKTLSVAKTVAMQGAESSRSLPFADSRLPIESEEERGGAASRAGERLEWLRGNFNQVFFSHFRSTQIPGYDPTSDWEIRLENDKLKQGVKAATVSLEKLTEWVIIPQRNRVLKDVRTQLNGLIPRSAPTPIDGKPPQPGASGEGRPTSSSKAAQHP